MPSFPISAPPLTPSTEKISLVVHNSAIRSPQTGHTTVLKNYSEWEVKLTFAAQKRTGTSAAAYMAWFDSLNGVEGTFTYKPHGSGKAVTGKTLYSTAFAYSTEIVVKGWTGTQATGLAAGDFLTLAGRLHRITSIASTTTSGRVTISIAPALRADVAVDAAVEFANPTLKLRLFLADDEAPGVLMDTDAIYIDPITAREAL